AREFTTENVARVTDGVAAWLLKKNSSPSVVVGHDCRFGGEMFAETVAGVLCSKGIKVFLAKGFVSTPMISMGALRMKCDLGIVITASHNPPAYNGFKLKGPHGGPLFPKFVEEIEKLIPENSSADSGKMSVEEFQNKKLLEFIDLEKMYIEHVEKNFDLKLIRNSKLNLAYDAMFGAGQDVMKKLLPGLSFLHCENNPTFNGTAPEPILKNLLEFSEMISKNGKIDCGLATDGDADRLGLFDNNGNFIDSHHIILLLIHYLVEYKKMSGKVVTAFSTTPRVAKLCKHYGLESETVKIGFKYISEIMDKEDVLLGGEESGGIAIKGHIPERDGIWMGLVIWEYMAKSGKSLHELIEEVYAITGAFAFERNDLHLDETVKQKIVSNCANNAYKSFGKYAIVRTEDLDGYKYFFDNEQWLLVRASGTEPVLRLYAESSTREGAMDILEEARKTFFN
ncbi:MAG: phosphoglucomutase/phosphomannomutase family protein, partial [Bacteroidia bacterium]|nr:phosphoglucomutase/phosphomannomutase family protein [Bacteroidia bacterium]